MQNLYMRNKKYIDIDIHLVEKMYQLLYNGIECQMQTNWLNI